MAEEPTLKGEDVVRYPGKEDDILDGTRNIIQGTPTEDGCEFELELSATPVHHLPPTTS